MNNYSIKQIYKLLQSEHYDVTWWKLVAKNTGLSKWIFILRLSLLRRLTICDRLIKWGITTDPLCPLCSNEDEIMQHIFFERDTSRTSGTVSILQWQGISKTSLWWQEQMGGQGIKYGKWHSRGANIYRVALAATVYYARGKLEVMNGFFKKKATQNNYYKTDCTRSIL